MQPRPTGSQDKPDHRRGGNQPARWLRCQSVPESKGKSEPGATKKGLDPTRAGSTKGAVAGEPAAGSPPTVRATSLSSLSVRPGHFRIHSTSNGRIIAEHRELKIAHASIGILPSDPGPEDRSFRFRMRTLSTQIDPPQGNIQQQQQQRGGEQVGPQRLHHDGRAERLKHLLGPRIEATSRDFRDASQQSLVRRPQLQFVRIADEQATGVSFGRRRSIPYRQTPGNRPLARRVANRAS